MREILRAVQFPHPGPEPAVRDGVTPWNMGAAHKRKFLVHPGEYLDRTNRLHSGTIGFWGEWEPPSAADAVEQRVEEDHGWGPQYLHRPYLAGDGYADMNNGEPGTCAAPGTAPSGGCQNTDPFVFGDRFLYCNCRQTRRNRTNSNIQDPTGLQELAPGSLILFGSCIGGAFALDTVFVVDDATPYVQAENGDAIRRMTPRVYHDATLRYTPRNIRYTLYRGAMYAEERKTLFSFFPCMPMDKAPDGFPRPVLRPEGALADVIVPGLSRTVKIKPERTSENVREIWHEVVRQVRGYKRMLGVRAELPPRRRPLPR